MKTHLKLIALLFVLLANLVTPAEAITAHGRRILGIIEKVNAQSHEIEMQRADDGTRIKFIWNKQTDFIAYAQFTDATSLKKGARVEVIRHAPFFGSPFVTKATLLQTNNPTKKTK